MTRQQRRANWLPARSTRIRCFERCRRTGHYNPRMFALAGLHLVPIHFPGSGLPRGYFCSVTPP